MVAELHADGALHAVGLAYGQSESVSIRVPYLIGSAYKSKINVLASMESCDAPGV